MRFKYTSQHIEFLKTGYLSMDVEDLAAAFNNQFGAQKTATAIKSALNKRGIKCGRKQKDRFIKRYHLLSADQVAFIKKGYQRHTLSALTDLLNQRFNTAVTHQQLKTFTENHAIRSGRTGRFEKGHASWNKGTKGQGLTRANATSFKKGQVPPNQKAIGSERICSKDGYISIKINETNPYTGFSTRYKHKQVYLWEQANGPVPKGHIVAFKDGDKTNFDPDNFMLLTRSELCRLNQLGYKDLPGELKPSVLALVKLKVKTWEKEKDAKEKK